VQYQAIVTKLLFT